MKRHTLYIFLLLIMALNNVLPVQAQQTTQYALYNYRNDGNFNAWLNIDIDSITYSCIDTLGIEHDEVMVQEVWTPDSVYRIPLEVIDSIGFHAPEPVMQDGIFYLRDYHAIHTIAIDSLTIFFDTSVHRDSLPTVGQVVTAAIYSYPYEDGFAGIVDNIEYNSNGIKLTCQEANVSDIFKKLVIVGKVIGNPEGTTNSKSRRVIDERDHFENIPIPDIKLSVLNGILSVESKNPYLNCQYSVYVDELMYNISADVYIRHPELSFQVAFKLSDLIKIGTSASNALYELITGSDSDSELKTNREVLEECLSEGIPIPLVKTGVFNLTLKLSPMIKLGGDLELDLLTKTSAKQHIGFNAAGYTKLAQLLNLIDPTIPVGEINGTLRNRSFSSERAPMSVKELKAKVSGKVAQGVIVQLEANLVSKKLVHASIGVEWARQLSGQLQFNLYDSSTDGFDKNFYDLIKDSKVEVKDYAKLKGEIGASPSPYWSLGGEVDLYENILGEYYIVPHFTEPSLPKFENNSWNNLKPLSLYSTLSKDIVLSCKPGMKIVDLNGDDIKKVEDSDLYQYEVEWKYWPLSIDISNLTPGETYRCYPTFSILGSRYFKAGPYHEFTVPQLMSATPEEVSLSIGSSSIIEIVDGWDTFAVVISGDEDVVSFVNDETTDARHIKIIGNKVGKTALKIEDRRTGEVVIVPITVTNDIPAEPMDLGLPSGTKWASYNVGATKPEEYGGYYAWGETEVRDQYYFTTYSLCDGTVSSCHDIGENISGTEYDVAHVKWGGEWCMPTKDDFQELVYTCEYKETTRNGVKGYQFTGPNGKYIFLPYTGYYWNTENSNVGSEGCYWSATQTTSVNRAHEMSFKKDEVLWDCYINRFAGLSVRPVMHSTSTLADLTLSTTDPVTVVVDDKATIEITSGNGSYTAESDNEDVAIARVYDNASVIIKGVSVGTATITVTDTKSGRTATVAVTVTGTINPDVSPGEAIDLGLPSGTKWASCNVGASKPEDYGGYYAWGETEEKDYYDESTYKYYQNGSYVNLGSDISGTEYDVAHVKWGGKWCMPTTAEQRELLDNCTTEWTSLNGVKGRKFTSKINGNSIFLPAAGRRRYGGLSLAGKDGHYWSSTQLPDYSLNAYYLDFNSGSAYWYDGRRFYGRSVRPVVRN